MSEVAIPQRGTNVAAQLDSLVNASGTFKTTFDTSSPEGQAMAFSALANAEPVADHLNETINLVHFVGQAVTVTDPSSGEVTDATRVVLIDADGNNYAAVSNELIRSLSTLVAIYGPADTWQAPVPVKVVEQRSKRGFRFYSLTPAAAAKAGK